MVLRRLPLQFAVVGLQRVRGGDLQKEGRVLPSPKTPSLSVRQIIALDIAGDVVHRTRGNSIPNSLFTTNPCSFVHSDIHLVACRGMIDLCHPGSHDMNGTKDDITYLLARLGPRN